MPDIRVLLLTLFISLVCLPLVFSVDPPVSSPTPPPESGSYVPSPSPTSPSESPKNSSPAPPPLDSAPGSAPTPSPDNAPAPAPAPGDAGGVSHAADSDNMQAEEEHSSSMSAGKKVGIAFGVILGICAVGLGALVYKKRQQNIRRSEFGYATREVL